jgi:hypothetical protein
MPPTENVRPPAALRSVISFKVEYNNTVKRRTQKTLSWHAGRLTVFRRRCMPPARTHLNPEHVLRFGNYVRHRTDRRMQRGGTEIIARRGINKYAAPVVVPGQLETTAVYFALAHREVKPSVVSPSPARAWTESDLVECLSEDSPLHGGRSFCKTYGLGIQANNSSFVLGRRNLLLHPRIEHN